MMIYDESHLIKMLDALPRELRTAFAALCAERLAPAYAAFAGRLGSLDAAKLTSILGRLWLALNGEPITGEEIQSDLDLCMTLIQADDEGQWSSLRAYAEDAVASVAYALRAQQNGESQEAAWAARRAYEAIDHFVINRDKIDTSEVGAEKRIIDHPLVQQELAQQQKDLDDLNALAHQSEWREELTKLRARAAVHSYDFLII
ncbi:MAG TPA: DUF416 family protein [Methylocystis sp.]|nr:DUF416 family protein [Methylocystis sp.]